jgi:hypothetical protein
MIALLSALHRTTDAALCRREVIVKTFENATSLVLALAAQALTVGLILAL